MDTIGLLAAWIGVTSFLFAIAAAVMAYLILPPLERWWAATSPPRAQRRIQRLLGGIEMSESPPNAYLSDLISLYGSTILNLVAAVALIIVSIEMLDLAPAVLASILPFNVDSKILTRISGLMFLAGAYFFIFRLAYLGVKIRTRALPRKPGYVPRALREIDRLRKTSGLPTGQREDPVPGSGVQVSALRGAE